MLVSKNPSDLLVVNIAGILLGPSNPWQTLLELVAEDA